MVCDVDPQGMLFLHQPTGPTKPEVLSWPIGQLLHCHHKEATRRPPVRVNPCKSHLVLLHNHQVLYVLEAGDGGQTAMHETREGAFGVLHSYNSLSWFTFKNMRASVRHVLKWRWVSWNPR